MPYTNFTLPTILKQFSLTLNSQTDLHALTSAATVRPEFESYLARIQPLGLNSATDKSRAEFITAPILTEFWLMTNRSIGLHSGVELTVEPEAGLDGVCDFLITRSPKQLLIVEPMIVVTEAKNENMKSAYGPCIAQMLAVRRFNEQEGTPHKKIYGAATAGWLWKFLEMEGDTVRIDTAFYYFSHDLAKILGILLRMAE